MSPLRDAEIRLAPVVRGGPGTHLVAVPSSPWDGERSGAMPSGASRDPLRGLPDARLHVAQRTRMVCDAVAHPGDGETALSAHGARPRRLDPT